MSYIPHSPQDIKEMLQAAGLNSPAELFKDIKPALKAKSFNIPAGSSEFEVSDYFHELSTRYDSRIESWIGAGYYTHFIPSAVDALSSRGEFATAYTPYQPEASQGTLQALFEYQTAICELTGMDVSNASLYDGTTALAEAVMMALRITGRKKVLADKWVNPLYLKVLQSYMNNLDVELVIRDLEKDHDLDEEFAALVIQTPDFLGDIRDYSKLILQAQTKNILVIENVYPQSLGLLKSPGEKGVDIAVAEGQSLGNPLSFGGPYLGIIATREKYVRKLPGRIVGETLDRNGKRAFVLTLQAREQHIKRERANSNICSNQSLVALRAAMYLSLVGKQGFQSLARTNFDKSEYAKNILGTIPGVSVRNSHPTFNEFTLALPIEAGLLLEKLKQKRILPGLPLGSVYPELSHCLLVSVTEIRNKAAIDRLSQSIREALK